jgi:poly-gamma-glutamate synthesis protein (capsule biosynthesis protein)
MEKNKKIILIAGVLVFFLILTVLISQPFFKNYFNSCFENKSFFDLKFFSELKPAQVSLIAVGDIMLTRGVETKIAKYGSDYPFLKIRDYLNNGDIVFGNLETPIAEGRAIKPGEMLFRSNPGLEKELKASNFSIVSLANNHTLNFGRSALTETFQYLNEVGIKYVGAGINLEQAYSPTIIKINNFSFAFLAFNDIDFTPESYGATEELPGIAFMNEERMVQAVKQAKNQADFVIVSMHSGYEYHNEPNEKQKRFARLAIKSGAEMVIGHHPHVVQSIEKYNDKYIFYSLGNFIFDQMWSEETREGAIIKVIFDKSGVKDFEIKATKIYDYCQPDILSSKESEPILKRMPVETIFE